MDLKNFTLGNQQGGNIATQSVRKVEYNKIGPTTQQKTTTTTTSTTYGVGGGEGAGAGAGAGVGWLAGAAF